VASTAEQIPALDALAVKAAANGVLDLERLSAAEASALEPEVACVGALLSPSTGIVDVHELMLSLLGDAETAGAALAVDSPVAAAEVTADGFGLEIGGAAPTT